jgi:hypothetical protein
MEKDWQEGIKSVLKNGKKKLDQKYEQIKEKDQKKEEVKAQRQIEKTEMIRREKIKEDRKKRQVERRRIKNEAINSRIKFVFKSLCLAGVLIWACWFTTDFVYNYDLWIAKYHKWSIEYEAQEPARAQAEVKYAEKKRLELLEYQENKRKEAIAAENRRTDEAREKAALEYEKIERPVSSLGNYTVAVSSLKVRLSPSSFGEVTNRLGMGQKVTVEEIDNGWGRVSRYYDGAVEGKSGMVARWVDLGGVK